MVRAGIKSREAGLHSSASLKIKSNTMKNTEQRYASNFSFPRIMLIFYNFVAQKPFR